MKINIIAAGKLKQQSLKDLVNSYLVRIKTLKIQIKEIDDKNLKKSEVNKLLFNNLKSKFLIILDERGKSLTSMQFSNLLYSDLLINKSDINFIIGGSEGIEESYFNNSDIVLSMGHLTFPHLIIRLLLVEQLYRAESIYLNHPYHRE